MSLPSNQVFYFGDSLTDVGVIFGALTQGLVAQILPTLLGPDPTPEEIADAEAQALILATQQATLLLQSNGFGPENAVTNEFTHAIYASDVTGDSVVNLANAGARALGTQDPFAPPPSGYDSNLGAQLGRFDALPPGSVLPGSKAVLFVGSNDFSDALGASGPSIFELITAATTTSEALLTSLETAARGLDASGVETIYFGTLPASSFFPSSDILDDLTLGFADLTLSIYNAQLAQLAADLRAEGIAADIIDYAALASAFTEDPSSFGVIADRSEFLFDGAPVDSDQVGFWDPLHPAEAVHQAWGAYGAFVMLGGSTDTLNDFGNLSFQDNDNNAVFALGGNDLIFARGGDDIILAGTGNDAVFAGSGDDIVSAGSGDDTVRGQSGEDLLAGGLGDDTIFGGSGADVLFDGLGNDLLRGGSGNDNFVFVQNELNGGTGPSQDAMQGGSGSDMLYLVLDTDTFDDFETNGAASVLFDLGITTRSIETVVAIDGRQQVESVLGGFDWFQDADYWGLIPAPTLPDVFA